MTVSKSRFLPSAIRENYARHGYFLRSLIRQGRLLEATLYAPYLFDTPLYDRFLDARADGDGAIEVTVNGHRMFVHSRDIGLSRELLITGEHEAHATEAFGRALRRIGTTVTAPSAVLEIGANLGYFVLLEARCLPESEIYAIEPVPENRTLLRRNVELNGLSERVTIGDVAVSDADGLAKLYLHSHSNCATLSEAAAKKTDAVDHLSVETVTIRTFLDQEGIEPEHIDAIRMDVEGLESAIFSGGLDELLFEIPDPLVLFIELHPEYLSDVEYCSILDALADRFEFVSGYRHDYERLLATFDSLAAVDRERPDWVELVLQSGSRR